MSKSILLVALLSHLIMPLSVLRGQVNPGPTKADPYRNFVGDWSGTALVNPDNEPPAVTLHISEEKDGGRMRWDYVFGKPGEKGYTQATKWITFKPAKEEMSTKWKGHPGLEFKTVNLNQFADQGFGAFGALMRGASSRCTYELRPATLDYLWETSDGKTYKIYSKFHFTRDGAGSTPPNLKEHEIN